MTTKPVANPPKPRAASKPAPDIFDLSPFGYELRPELKALARRNVMDVQRTAAETAETVSRYRRQANAGMEAVRRAVAGYPEARRRQLEANAAEIERQRAASANANPPQPWRGPIAPWPKEPEKALPILAQTPANLARAAKELWIEGIRDDQKYYSEINPYEQARILREYNIADPNSPAARQALDTEQFLRAQTLEARRAEWDSLSPPQQIRMALGYGGEQGAFKGGAQILRAEERAGGRGDRIDERYHWEQLPHTFAREDRPVSYGLGEALGAVSLARVISPLGERILNTAGAGAEGYYSEPGDRYTRGVNAGVGAAGSWLGDKTVDGLTNPLGKILKQQIEALKPKYLISPIPTPAPRVSPAAAPIPAPAPRVPAPGGPDLRLTGEAAPGWDSSWRFEPGFVVAPSGPSAGQGSGAQWLLDERLNDLRPSQPGRDGPFDFTRDVAGEIASQPVKDGVETGVGKVGEALKDLRKPDPRNPPRTPR